MIVKELREILNHTNDNLTIYLSDGEEGIRELRIYDIKIVNTSCDTLRSYLKIG